LSTYLVNTVEYIMQGGNGGSGRRGTKQHGWKLNAGVEIVAPENRGGKRDRNEYGKPKFA